MLVLSYL